ncbi:MAG: glycerophosphodiester phosphodiesterase [Devosia sp.]
MQRRVIAHRGHTVGAPEQTLLAYRRAIELGAEMIEADLRFSRDGVGVMLHDARLDRTTDGHGLVSDMDWADIARLDAGSWFSRETAGLRVPRLEELFDLAQAAGTALCIEAKGDRHDENRHAAVTAAQEIARRGRLELDVVASFDHRALAEAAAAVPGLRTAPDRLPERGPSTASALIAQARAARAAIIQHHFADLEARVVAEVQAAGIEVWAWPPATPAEAQFAFDSGAIGLMGDDVAAIASVVGASVD